MREVISLQYDATTRSVLAAVANTKESEHVPGTFVRQLGLPEPTARHSMAEMPPAQRAAFQAFLDFICTATEQKHAAMASDPVALAGRASALAEREQKLERDEAERREALAAETSAALKIVAEAEEKTEAKRAELAELDASIAARAADMKEIQAES